MRAWELHQKGSQQKDIAKALGVTPGSVSQWRSLKKLVQQPIFPSRGVAVVVVDDTTQHRATTNWT